MCVCVCVGDGGGRTLTNVVKGQSGVCTMCEGPPDLVGTFLVPGSNAR